MSVLYFTVLPGQGSCMGLLHAVYRTPVSSGAGTHCVYFPTSSDTCCLLSHATTCCLFCAVGGILLLGGGYLSIQSGATLSCWLLFGVIGGLEVLRGLVMLLMTRAYPVENLSAP